MSEKPVVDLLKQKIEQKLAWGPIAHWSSYDLEKLSVLIQEKTGIVLSLSTLRRFFDKIKSSSRPSVTTLNTLSQWLGYADFRDFTAQNAKNGDDIPSSDGQFSPKANPLPTIRLGRKHLIIALSISTLLVLAYFFSNKIIENRQEENPDNFSFAANKIRTKGLPNSVIFSYEASKAKADSIFIVQNWDIRRRIRVPKNGRNHSAIYYYPGYFRSKLMAGNQIIKTHDIHIVSEGWLAMTETDFNICPQYISEKISDENGAVHIDDENLTRNNIKDPEAMMRLFHHTGLMPFFTDDFTFEADVKNNTKMACAKVRFMIHGVENIIAFPLVDKYCVGEIGLGGMGKNVESKYADLSKFGVELNTWNHIKVVGKKQTITFLVNNTLAYTLKYDVKPVQLLGLQLRFSGDLDVKGARFSGSGKEIKLK